MFCYQCEQTAKGEGCDKSGVCGKLPDVAALQDLLVYALTGLAQAAAAARKAGIRDHEADVFTCEALFATLTNVDFDPARFSTLIHRAAALRDGLLEKLRAAGVSDRFPGRGGHTQTGGRSSGADRSRARRTASAPIPPPTPISSRSSTRSCTGSRGWPPMRTTR